MTQFLRDTDTIRQTTVRKLTSEVTSRQHIATPRIPEEYKDISSGSKLRNNLEIVALGALGRISEIKIKSGSLSAMNITNHLFY